ncbi:hypothetical protein FNU3_14 [Fusobacterium phage vB_FnuS_FNU3]|uniref:Uncharacterized protein n=1 Tax=Fusobacterium phage Fnu1 TaxID=2530024 RepID=A0A481W7D9_9CAUD|nr:hypothetical protein KMD24_gp025 [Fusobacterium phage Fnu1]QBJ04095.1 hypothetical protein [Fusobacterium phage Fnu1]WGH50224.1 hypothetical protein FNU2_135 [Fusobacterium phage vB_FnuS_FNU2]WGH50371.1 hypothetical protein FNU3_14 [Fusobacterium phage vB_FnuS_FNU3]
MKLAKRLKEIRENNHKTIVVDLGVIHENLKGLELPFKIKPFNEVLSLKASIKLPDIDMKDCIKTVPFRLLSEETKRMYREERPDLAYDTALIMVIDDTKNRDKFKKRELELKLLDSLLHIDFDCVFENEEGKEITLWEDLGLEKGNYQGALEIFCDVLSQSEMIELLNKLVSLIKAKVTDIKDLTREMDTFKFWSIMDSLPKEKREETLLSLQKDLEKRQKEIKALEDDLKTSEPLDNKLVKEENKTSKKATTKAKTK